MNEHIDGRHVGDHWEGPRRAPYLLLPLKLTRGQRMEFSELKRSLYFHSWNQQLLSTTTPLRDWSISLGFTFPPVESGNGKTVLRWFILFGLDHGWGSLFCVGYTHDSGGPSEMSVKLKQVEREGAQWDGREWVSSRRNADTGFWGRWETAFICEVGF